MEPLIDHIEVTVRDMSTAVPFYDRLLPLLGFDPARRSEATLEGTVEGSLKHVVTYEHPRLGFAITSPLGAFAAEADRLHLEVRALGATIVIPPRELPEYTSAGTCAFFVKDPDGIKYELVCTAGDQPG